MVQSELKVIALGDREGLKHGKAAGTEIESRKHKARQERKRRYYLRQKIAGIILLLVALPSFLWLNGNGIATVILTPTALCLIFRRQIDRLAYAGFL